MFALCQRPLTRGCSLTILAPPLTRSLGENRIGVKGASALAAGLKETKITTLGCATSRDSVLFSVSALTRTFPPTVPQPIPGSIRHNCVGDEGASALAAILKETMISNLECAAT